MTEPGLGKVGAPERRTTTLRDGIDADPGVEVNAPITAPPPSAGGVRVRQTRALEKNSGTEPERAQTLLARPAMESSERGRTTPTPAARPDPRSDEDDRSTPPPSSARLDREEPRSRGSSARIPIDVTHVDTNRIAKGPASQPASRLPNSRPPAGGAAGARDTGSRPARSMPSDKPGSFDAGRRQSVAGFAAAETPTGRRPIGSRAPSAPPVEIGQKEKGPARSKRVSIREDNLGSRVGTVGDAVNASGRTVPKLLKSKAEIAAAPIDHRAGFLLAHVDGVTTVQGLVDVTGMPEEEVDTILDRLRRLGIVALR